MPLIRSGEFARNAGVTVRTLRYYDRVGLLKPSSYSESGQRLYADADYARLQQILTLKLIGLSLNEIKRVLSSGGADMAHLLERQKQALQAQVRQLTRVIYTLEQAQARMNGSRSAPLADLINIIKAVNEMTGSNWFEQFLTDDQLQQLASLNSDSTLDEQKAFGVALQSLFEDIARSLDTEAHSPRALTLLRRWDALMRHAARNDPALATAVSTAYQHIAEATAPDSQSWTNGLQDAARFIQKVREAQENIEG